MRPAGFLTGLVHGLEKEFAVGVVFEDRFATVAAARDVHYPNQGRVGTAVPGWTSNSTEASFKPSASAVTVTCPGALPACRVTKAMPLNTGRELA